MRTKTYSNLISITLAILLFWVIKTVGIILVPICIAMILTYITNPLIKKLHNTLKLNICLVIAIATIFILLIEILIPTVLVPTLINQVKFIVSKLPFIIDLINNKILNSLNIRLDSTYHLDINTIKNFIAVKSDKIDTARIISSIATNSSLIMQIVFFILLTPFVFYYTATKWDRIIENIKQMIPMQHKKYTVELVQDIDQMLSAYLRGQAIVMCIQMVYYVTALNIIGLNFATTIGAMTGFLVFIPVFGFWSGVLSALLVSLSGVISYILLIKIAVAFAIGNLLENTLTPYFIGHKLGLNPIFVIFALLIFGQIFGLIGIILSLPLTTISVVIVRHMIVFYKSTDFYNGRL